MEDLRMIEEDIAKLEVITKDKATEDREAN